MSRGTLHIKAVERTTGRVLWERNRPNLIVNTGRAAMAAAGASFITHAGAGTSASAPTPDDVAPLANQHLVALDAIHAPSSRERVFVFTIPGDDLAGQTTCEFGLFTAAGDLVARWVDSPGWPMRAGVDLVGNWYVTF